MKCGTHVDAGAFSGILLPGAESDLSGVQENASSVSPILLQLPSSWSCLLATAPRQDLGSGGRDVTLSMHQSLCHLWSDTRLLTPVALVGLRLSERWQSIPATPPLG